MKRIVLVHTYPIGHDCHSFEEWLSRTWREQEIARSLARRGLEVEVWAVRDVPEERERDGITYCMRARPDDVPERTADWKRGTHFLLKGLDGSFGKSVLSRMVFPSGMRHSYIIGGTPWTRHAHRAVVLLYESTFQKHELMHPRRFWRRRIHEDRLLFLPKRIDLEAYRPGSDVEKPYDLVIASRLMRRYKDFSILDRLDPSFRVVVMGDGDYREELMARHPDMTWLGHVAHVGIPDVLRQAKLFFHTSFKDYHPRALAEAFACGLPIIAPAGGNVRDDVVPSDRGAIVEPDTLNRTIRAFLDDPGRLSKASLRARAHADATYSAASLESALDAFVNRIERP